MSAWELGQSQRPPQGKGGTQGVADQPGAQHFQMPADLDHSDPLLMLAYDKIGFRFIYQREHRHKRAESTDKQMQAHIHRHRYGHLYGHGHGHRHRHNTDICTGTDICAGTGIVQAQIWSYA